MDNIEKARKTLVGIMPSQYEQYIYTRLAGDFATELVKVLDVNKNALELQTAARQMWHTQSELAGRDADRLRAELAAERAFLADMKIRLEQLVTVALSPGVKTELEFTGELIGHRLARSE